MFEEEQKLAVYEYELNGVTTTVQLSEQDAEKVPGAKKVGEVPTRASTTPPGPADPEATGGTPVTSKARTARNK
ncbi:MAG: hypothetical protein M3N52_12115 [Actinomycetota bacterium]|nr:hypothetical protein [Actinomycetota bacterium]